MKCLVIHGSPRKGNTWALVKEVEAQLQTLGDVEFDEVVLGQVQLPLCKGCFNCFMRGEDTCPHAAVVQPLVQKLHQADCWIFTSPVYALSLSATLKNLLDHLAYVYHRPCFFDKKALVITSTAGAGAKKTAAYIRDTLKHWGVNRCYCLPFQVMAAQRGFAVTPAIKKKIAPVVVRFYADVSGKKLYAPTMKRVFYYNIWRAFNRTGQKENTQDYQYWHQHGLLSNAYAPGVPVPLPLRAAGGCIHAIISKLMPGA